MLQLTGTIIDMWMASSVEVLGTHTRSKQLAPWGAQVPIHRPTISRATGRMPPMYSGPSTKGCTANGVYTLDRSTRCQSLVVASVVVASLIQGGVPSWWYMCTLNWRQTVLKSPGLSVPSHLMTLQVSQLTIGNSTGTVQQPML